jgi:hypothetical protein
LVSPPTARAFNPVKPICTVAGLFNGVAQKACSVVSQVAGGAASTATTALTVAAVVTWAVGGAKFLLHETSNVLAKTTAPQLTSTWFSSTYWRVAGIAAVLTLPFLFAAAIQALLRSDVSLLIRAALGYLPMALLAVAIAAPLTMLLLAASDQLSAIVSSAAGNQSAHFLDRAAGLLGVTSVFDPSTSFVGFLVALFTAAGAVVLWMELLVREAAVYVIVLMLPLAFAAFVWPARRIWAIRSIELLIALILSKFAIVAVLSLGGAALSESAGRSVTGLLAGAVLMALAAFAPWAMLRVVPLTEIASGAAASLRGGASTAFQGLQRADAWTSEADQWASRTAQMRHTAQTGNGAVDGAATADGAVSADFAVTNDDPVIADDLATVSGAGVTDGATAAKEGLVANVGSGGLVANAGGEGGDGNSTDAPSSVDPPAGSAPGKAALHETGGAGAIHEAGGTGAVHEAGGAGAVHEAGGAGAVHDVASPGDAGSGEGTGHVTTVDPPSWRATRRVEELDLEDMPPLDHRRPISEVDPRGEDAETAEVVDPTPPPQPEAEA